MRIFRRNQFSANKKLFRFPQKSKEQDLTKEGGPRRDFLRLTGAGVAGAMVGSVSLPANAKPTAATAGQYEVRPCRLMACTLLSKNVEDFNLYQSRPLQDTHLDKVEQQTL